VTTDYGDVFGEIASKHLARAAEQVFPGYNVDPRRWRGVLKA